LCTSIKHKSAPPAAKTLAIKDHHDAHIPQDTTPAALPPPAARSACSRAARDPLASGHRRRAAPGHPRPVVGERIETEARTASGISDGKGHLIAGVLLITAGYSANGKYSYFLLTQVPFKIGDTVLAPGDYLIGWTRGENELHVTLSQAATGKPVAEATAVRNPAIHRVESFHLWPPDTLSALQFGRFTVDYTLP
jgi:hypothetical protein